MRPLLLCSALLLAIGPVSAAQVYKWVDDKGVTHFDAQPPVGVEASSVNTKVNQPKKAIPDQVAPSSSKEPNEAQQKAIDAKVKQDVAAQEAERQRFCEMQRSNLSQLMNNPRIRIEENGQTRRLTEEERQQRINEAKKGIAENCD